MLAAHVAGTDIRLRRTFDSDRRVWSLVSRFHRLGFTRLALNRLITGITLGLACCESGTRKNFTRNPCYDHTSWVASW